MPILGHAVCFRASACQAHRVTADRARRPLLERGRVDVGGDELVRDGEKRQPRIEEGAIAEYGLGHVLQYLDQGISQPELMEEIAGRLRRIIAEARPDVVVTFGPDGATGHADHRAVSNIVTVVFQERELLAYRPKKLYYVAMAQAKGFR